MWARWPQPLLATLLGMAHRVLQAWLLPLSGLTLCALATQKRLQPCPRQAAWGLCWFSCQADLSVASFAPLL